jgi:hypothetical protein
MLTSARLQPEGTLTIKRRASGGAGHAPRFERRQTFGRGDPHDQVDKETVDERDGRTPQDIQGRSASGRRELRGGASPPQAAAAATLRLFGRYGLRSRVGAAEGGYHSFQPLYDWIVTEEPDLLN